MGTQRLLGLKNGVIDPPHHPPLFCFSLSILLLSPAIKLTGTWVDNRKRNGRTLMAPLGGDCTRNLFCCAGHYANDPIAWVVPRAANQNK
jgi:hypothetical protein